MILLEENTTNTFVIYKEAILSTNYSYLTGYLQKIEFPSFYKEFNFFSIDEHNTFIEFELVEVAQANENLLTGLVSLRKYPGEYLFQVRTNNDFVVYEELVRLIEENN